MKTASPTYPTIAPATRCEHGFTLIELMIALGIGLLLLAGLFYIYSNAAQSFRSQSALAYIQGNARYAFEIMGVDIRQAGFVATRRDDVPVNVVNALTSCNDNLKDLFVTPLIGYENTNPPDVCTTAGTTACYQANTDSLTVVRTDTENKYAVSAHLSPDFTLTSWPAGNAPAAGEIFVAADHSHAAVFQVSSVNSGTGTVSYDMVGAAPGNSGTALGAFYGGIASSNLMRLSGVSYYIGLNPAGEPALYRDKLTNSGTSADGVKEELIQGVEDMEITYGVDTDATADGNVNAYWTATEVAAGTDGTLTMPAGAASDYWRRVLSVRITLTLVSAQDERIAITTGDRRLRRTFSNTIAVRNRL